MAVPPLGKCIVLPLFLLLFYVGYGFRIRDVGQIEQYSSGCTIGHGKCIGDTDGIQMTLNSFKKRQDNTRGRISSGSIRQPPVDDSETIEKITEHDRIRSKFLNKKATPSENNLIDDDDDDDDDDGIVEDEEINDDNGDDDDIKKKIIKKDIKWNFRGASKISIDGDNDENDNFKTKTIYKHVDSKKTLNKNKEEQLENSIEIESDEITNKNEELLIKNENKKIEEIKIIENKEIKDDKLINKKFEKIRLANKDKIKSIELPVINDDAKDKKIEKNKKIEKIEKIEIEKSKSFKEESKIQQKQINENEKKKNDSDVKTSVEKEEKKKIIKDKEKLKSISIKEQEKIKENKNKEKSKQKIEIKKSNVEVKIKKEIEINKKKPIQLKKQENSISLSKLNEMILQLPNFVPNFTAIEDPLCQQHGKIFLRQLRGRKLWALQMLDSNGKIPSGLLRGNVNQFGDFDQCLGIASKIKIDEKQTIKIQGKYCLASIDIQSTISETKIPVNLIQSRGFLRGNMKDSGHFVPKFTTINWALCIPSACSAADARNAIENSLSHLNSTSGVKFMVDVNPDMCYIQQKSSSYSKETIGVLYFYAMIVCLVFIATIRDYIVVSEKANYSERIIMSFSLRRTLKSLTKPLSLQNGDISCIHGIRSLATIALYVGHKMIPTAGIPYTNRIVLTEIANNPISSLLRVSLVYTDSFLLLSGVLTAFNMSRESTTRGEIRWFCRFIARVIRLTPSLLVVIFWYAFVMVHTGSGPQWNNIMKTNAELCKKNSWTNLFFIQNFFPFEEMCATHTHQLALDMQLSLLSPVLVFFLQIKPIIGILLIFFLLQLSATLRYFATINNNLSLVIFHGMTAKHLYKTANLTYAVSLHRATPYLFGISLGVLLHYTGKNIKIYKIFVIFGWIMATLLGSWSLFSPWRMARRDYIYDVEESAHYAVIGPVSWSLALCWVIFACCTDHGGFVNKFLSNYWLILFSRISYSVYLTQFAVFFYNVATTRYSSEFQVLKVLDPYEILMVIFVSTILTLFLDIPTQEIKNVLMESTDISLTQSEDKPENEKELKDIHKKPSKTPEPEEKNENWRKRDELNYSEDDDDNWRSKKANGKQKIFIKRNSKDDEIGYRTWVMKRDDVIDRRRSSSTQRTFYIDTDARIREMTPTKHLDEIRRERRSSSRPLESLKPSYNPDEILHSSDRRSPRRDRSHSRLSDRVFYRETESSSRTPTKLDRGRSPRPRKTPVRLISSGSEEEPLKIKIKNPRRPVERPRVSDEEDWEQELRIRRQKFRELKASEEQESKIEKDDSTDLSRRSSAEGKIALLQGPTGTRVMDAWTVSKGPRVSLGSSQEPTDTEEELRHIGDFDEPPIPERRQSLDSIEHEDIDFSFRSDVKTKTLMDLRQISAEEDIEKNEEIIGEIQPVPTGKLFKRESIIKSQASEEDPEYLLPERPKLVEQEQEHPFKKAWQMQKSKSEEDGPSAFAIKEIKTQSDNGQNKNNDEKKKSPSPPTEQTFHLIVEDVDSTNWQTISDSQSSATRSSEEIDPDEEEDNQTSVQSHNDNYSRSSRSANGTDSPKLDWPDDDEQFDRYRRQKRQSEAWESDET